MLRMWVGLIIELLSVLIDILSLFPEIVNASTFINKLFAEMSSFYFKSVVRGGFLLPQLNSQKIARQFHLPICDEHSLQ